MAALVLEYVRPPRAHDIPDEPVEIRCAVLPDLAVPRRVEIFAGGRAEAVTLAWHAAIPRFRASASSTATCRPPQRSER
jgi:hypothetical protein